MNNMPKKLREELSEDPEYSRCMREGGDCGGRITWEHTTIFAGRQLQEKWAIISLCWYHHLGDGLDKNINRWIALSRATDEDLAKYPKAYKEWKQLKKYLTGLYGKYRRK
jgi:hypothetical protein